VFRAISDSFVGKKLSARYHHKVLWLYLAKKESKSEYRVLKKSINYKPKTSVNLTKSKLGGGFR
jgi:hypothetical protein